MTDRTGHPATEADIKLVKLPKPGHTCFASMSSHTMISSMRMASGHPDPMAGKATVGVAADARRAAFAAKQAGKSLKKKSMSLAKGRRAIHKPTSKVVTIMGMAVSKKGESMRVVAFKGGELKKVFKRNLEAI